MAVTITPLFEPVQIANAATVYFTAQVPTQIQKLTVANPSNTTAYSVTLYWVPNAGAAGVTNAIQTTRFIQALETWDAWPFIGHVLNPGDAIAALASVAAKLNFFGSGTQVSG